ncbi:MAG: CHAT domain-containing protein [Cyanobacteria bacterium P01_C01_bin.72]
MNWKQFILAILFGWSVVLGFNSALTAQVAPAQLVRQAQQQYEQGNSLPALHLLNQAGKIYQRQAAILPQAQVWALTSLVQQQQGNWQLATENIERSFTLIESIAPSPQKIQVQAQIWHAQGHYHLATGQYNQALTAWQQSEQLYGQIEDATAIAGTILGQADALGKMGFHRRACDRTLVTLDPTESRCVELTESQAKDIIKGAQLKSEPWLIDSLSSMGNHLLAMGRLNLALEFANASQATLSRFPAPKWGTENKLRLNLGNIHQAIALVAKEQSNEQRFEKHRLQATEYFRELERSVKTPQDRDFKLAAQLNELSLLLSNSQWSQAAKLANKIQLDSGSQRNLYPQVKFANSLKLLQQHNRSLKYDLQDIAQMYLNVAQQAHLSGDQRLESSALGNLGDIYDIHDDLETVKLPYTQQQLYERALSLAQAAYSPEIAYRWQWRLGRIYCKKGLRKQAIASYQAALANLDSLRSDLVALEKEIQYEFKEQIEPVYRELADLLLQGSPSDRDLEAARNVIEALQLAELDNYFQDACLTFAPKSIDQIDPHAAIIYTIVLPDRLETILATVNSGSSGRISYHHTQPVSQIELEQTIEQLQQYITEPDRTRQVQQIEAQLYSWLIQPLTAELEQHQPQTLVFVLDGMLQTIPMAALYDGQEYLLEKYAIALTPGLRLLNSQVNSRPLSFLAGGISRFQKVGDLSFAPLSNVQEEIETVSQSEDTALLNQQFTANNLLKQLNLTTASVIHLATHGQFRANPQKTFLLMWNELLNIKEFSSLLQSRSKIHLNPIKLLVLSACNTATGDRRAALGLAGVAVRSGARSTLATLWQVNDDSTTELMKRFYQYLKYHSKAEALRQAQMDLWQRADKDWKVPAFWSAYIMIGNWQ